MIEADKLEKRYRRREVLRGLSFKAEPGQVTLIVGANGAGKTTTLHILAGLVHADRGLYQIAGTSGAAARRHVSFLPQGVAFQPQLNCRQALQFYARVRGVDVGRADAMLLRLGLSDHVHAPTAELSGGLRQRLGLGLLLLPDAPVLLLDEPGLSLDPVWRARMQTILREEAARGKTILVTTHLVGEWNNHSDQCLVCDNGRITGSIQPGRLHEAFAPGIDSDTFPMRAIP